MIKFYSTFGPKVSSAFFVGRIGKTPDAHVRTRTPTSSRKADFRFPAVGYQGFVTVPTCTES